MYFVLTSLSGYVSIPFPLEPFLFSFFWGGSFSASCCKMHLKILLWSVYTARSFSVFKPLRFQKCVWGPSLVLVSSYYCTEIDEVRSVTFESAGSSFTCKSETSYIILIEPETCSLTSIVPLIVLLDCNLYYFRARRL